MHRSVTIPLILAALLLSACGPDWSGIERDITEARPDMVRDVAYDAADDFLIVTVSNDAAIGDAVDLSCETIQPILDEAGSFALFAVYAEDGRILTSWNRCLLLEPTPT